MMSIGGGAALTHRRIRAILPCLTLVENVSCNASGGKRFITATTTANQRLLPLQRYNNWNTVYKQRQQQQYPPFSNVSGSKTFASPAEEEKSTKLRDLLPELKKSHSLQQLSADELALHDLLIQDKQDIEYYEKLYACYEQLRYFDYATVVLKDCVLPQLEAQNKDIADVTFRIGTCHMNNNKPTMSSQCFQQSMTMYEEKRAKTGIPFAAEVCMIQIYMAGLQLGYHDDRDAALAIMMEAHQRLVKDAKPDDHHHTEIFIQCYTHTGLLHRAAADFQSALEWYSKAHNLSSTYKIRLDMADMHLALEQFDAAKEIYQELLDQTPSTNVDKDVMEREAVLRHTIGRIHGQLGNSQEAIDYLTKSIELKRIICRYDKATNDNSDAQQQQLFNPEIAKSLQVLGAVYAASNEKRKALECFQEVLLITRAIVLREEGRDSVELHPDVNAAINNIWKLTSKKSQ